MEYRDKPNLVEAKLIETRIQYAYIPNWVLGLTFINDPAGAALAYELWSGPKWANVDQILKAQICKQEDISPAEITVQVQQHEEDIRVSYYVGNPEHSVPTIELRAGRKKNYFSLKRSTGLFSGFRFMGGDLTYLNLNGQSRMNDVSNEATGFGCEEYSILTNGTNYAIVTSDDGRIQLMIDTETRSDGAGTFVRIITTDKDKSNYWRAESSPDGLRVENVADEENTLFYLQAAKFNEVA
ncbi:hypothetical protein SM033_00295 [Vibrio phage vB_VpaM_sm033]|nr:hypothetical protein SM033_00295 [Vibrio phage vB_VpaM_sm033]